MSVIHSTAVLAAAEEERSSIIRAVLAATKEQRSSTPRGKLRHNREILRWPGSNHRQLLTTNSAPSSTEVIWSCLRANWKKRARTRRHTRPPGRVHPAPYSTPRSSDSGAILPIYSTPWSSDFGAILPIYSTPRSSNLSLGHSMTPLDHPVKYHFATPPDITRPFTLPRYSTLWSSIITHHQHHHSTGHSITSSQSTQIRTQPDKLSTKYCTVLTSKWFVCRLIHETAQSVIILSRHLTGRLIFMIVHPTS
ncbi:hypothetical protein ISN44_Un135g000060 [Arabidopsis suecica]|uniref:Uncharacterized protein n=1 Tax=Arabidopsis suecica TaxID=45249 RepID=A0A8T1XAM6_ARASU|nr:hypothetical protein ISN44_Un135g000060 [Arabidopsis suecica]